MSKIIDYTNPPKPELTEQDKAFLAWLENTPDEASSEMLKAMSEVDDDLFKGVF